ncbi:hypothetical protein, partial [Mycoplasmopsis bovis]|uniref:hypothetical protein n=1 Tax=Mycoplasmopsis bovis TaxID=28903 RepID=UPI003D2A5F77
MNGEVTQASWYFEISLLVLVSHHRCLKSDKNKLTKLTDYINKRKDLDETTKKTYLQALTVENFKKIKAYLSKFKKLPQLTPKAGTAPINGEVLFNSFVGRMA